MILMMAGDLIGRPYVYLGPASGFTGRAFIQSLIWAR